MNNSNPIGILIHGCHLGAKDWEQIVFGFPTELGRVPIGINEAIEKNARLIFWGTGASQTAEGVKESQHTFNVTLHTKLKEIADKVQKTPEQLSNYLNKVSFIDVQSKNTAEEISSAFHECQIREIQELILISSPTHILRCHQEACILKKRRGIQLKVLALASETCYANSNASDPVIIEPPHRGDLPAIPFHITARKIFQFLKDEKKAQAYLNDWEALTLCYQKGEEKAQP